MALRAFSSGGGGCNRPPPWCWRPGYDGVEQGVEGNPDHGRWRHFGECPTCHRIRELTPDGLIAAHPVDHIYFTWYAKPLDEAIAEAQPSLFSDDGSAWGAESCDEGVCFI